MKDLQPAIASLPQTLTADGAPVFEEPWQARAFAIALTVVEQRGWEWDEFRKRLIAAIGTGHTGASHGAENSANYYEKWLLALEKLLLDKDLVKVGEINAKSAELAAATAAPEPADEPESGRHHH